MIISVASGKGGTGKTLVATSLALSLKEQHKVQLLDCDVEEPDSHLFLKPVITGSETVYIPVPKVNEAKCTYCGKCAQVCAYHAIVVLGEHILTFPQLCHGCGACSYLCPENTISEEGREGGVVEWGHSNSIEFVHGKLNVGEAMAPPVIRKVKERANNNGIVIVDAPPGTSCPVVESVKDGDFCILVTELTLSGIHDLERVLGVCRHFGVPALVCINKYDIDADNTYQIESFCLNQEVEVAARIPFDKAMTEAMVQGVPVVEYSRNGVPHQIEVLWEIVSKSLDK